MLLRATLQRSLADACSANVLYWPFSLIPRPVVGSTLDPSLIPRPVVGNTLDPSLIPRPLQEWGYLIPSPVLQEYFSSTVYTIWRERPDICITQVSDHLRSKVCSTISRCGYVACLLAGPLKTNRNFWHCILYGVRIVQASVQVMSWITMVNTKSTWWYPRHWSTADDVIMCTCENSRRWKTVVFWFNCF